MNKVFTATIFTAFFCLSSPVFSSDIDTLIKDLGNKDKAKNASIELAKIGKPAVPAIIKALGENDKYAKRYAARALREMGEEASDAIPALSNAIKDSDSQTREYAVEALGNMVNESEQVIPVLKKATKDGDSDVKKKAKEAVNKLQSSSSGQTDENGQSENPNTPSAQKALRDSIPLDKGIYGVPFNATIDEILVWVKNNNMIIADDNEQTILCDINMESVSIIKPKRTVQSDKQSLQELEQALVKIMKDNGPANILSDYSAASENASIEALLKKLEILKNPRFSYAGELYYLKSLFPDGLQSCEDPEITKTAFDLILKPTKDSERMKNNGLLELQILFYSNQEETPKTYATLARFGDFTQMALIYGAISEKYDSPESIKNSDFDATVNRAVGYIYYEDEAMSIIKNEMLHLAGAIFDYKIEIFMWARNILAIPSGHELYVLYYEPSIVDKLIEHHQKGIERCKEKYHKQINQDVNQIQKDF